MVLNHLLNKEDQELLKGLSEGEGVREEGDTMAGTEEETISQGTPGRRSNRSDDQSCPFINISKIDS